MGQFKLEAPHLQTIMSRFTIIAFLATAIVAMSMAEPIPRSKIALVRQQLLAQEPIQDCEHCAVDIDKAIEDCADIPPDDQHALLVCIEDALMASADCIQCICEIMGTIAGFDTSMF